VDLVLAGRSAQAAGGRNAVVTAVAVAFLLLLAGISQAAVPVGSDFRISTTGRDADTSLGANDAAVAYNSKNNEYLVVWYGDAPNDNEFQVFVQRISAATGSRLGGNIPISTPGNTSQGSFSPAVAYDSKDNEYLVVWYADTVSNDDYEIFAQRLSAVGAELPTGSATGAADFQISNTVPAGPTRAALDPAIAYDSTDNEYLVAWYADALASQDDEFESFGQRIAADTGAEIGTDDFQISHMDPAGIGRGAFAPAIAYSAQANEYLATWYGDGSPLADNEYEIWGQRISPGTSGAVIGSNVQISDVGPAGNANFDALNPAATYNPQTNEYLVVWYGDRPELDNEFEIFGQLVSASAQRVGGSIRISNVGHDGDKTRGPFFNSCGGCSPLAHNYVDYNRATNQYFAVWTANELPTPGEYEIFGQFISATGSETGEDFRISSFGTDGDTTPFPFNTAVASSSLADEYLVTWEGNGVASNPSKQEIFGHLLGTPPAATPPAPVGPTGSSETPTQLRLSVRAARFQKLRRKVLTLRVTCNVRCAITAASRVSVPRVRSKSSKSYKLRKVTATLTASKTKTVKMKLTRKVIRAAKRALKNRKRVVAAVGVTARDAGGTIRSARRSIRIRR
jgi:hypothetical protein